MSYGFENLQGERNFVKRNTVLALLIYLFVARLFRNSYSGVQIPARRPSTDGNYAGLITFPMVFVGFAVSLARAIKSGPPTQRTLDVRLRWGILLVLSPIFINTITM